MEAHEVAKLSLGLYRVYWESGDTSLAAVGTDRAGNHWLAPTDWINISFLGIHHQMPWDKVDRVEAIAPGPISIEPDDSESDAGAPPEAGVDLIKKMAGLEGRLSALIDAIRQSIRIDTSLRNRVIGLEERTDDLLKLHEKAADTRPSVSVGAPQDLEDTIAITGLRVTGSIAPPGPHGFTLGPLPPNRHEEDQHLHRTIEHVGAQVTEMIAAATPPPNIEWCSKHEHWIWGGPESLRAQHMSVK